VVGDHLHRLHRAGVWAMTGTGFVALRSRRQRRPGDLRHWLPTARAQGRPVGEPIGVLAPQIGHLDGLA